MEETVDSSRKRPNPTTSKASAYRLHFSFELLGKLRPATKRKILWRFAYTNATSSVTQQGQGCQYSGEEHEIQLIWSIRSGKTQLFWNQKKISSFFSQPQTGGVDLTWESGSGENFRIVAYVKPHSNCRQYEFFVGESSFFALPHLSEFRDAKIESEDPSGKTETSGGSLDPVAEEEAPRKDALEPCPVVADDEPPSSFNIRLTIAGFSPGEATKSYDDDELTSCVSPNNLELLRQQVTELLPGTQDMVSKAYINAMDYRVDREFSVSTSFDSSSLSCDSCGQTPMHNEADAIWETNEWIALNGVNLSRPELEDKKHIFLQKQIDKVFMHVRHDGMSETTALNIICSVATLLGMELTTSMKKDAVVLDQLDTDISEESLINSLSAYAEVTECSLSKGRKFGICRFSSEDGRLIVLEAAQEGNFLINGKKPIICALERPFLKSRPTLYSRAQSQPNVVLAKPTLARRKSHQRNTVSIDNIMTDSPFLQLVNEIPLVAPDPRKTFLRPNVFTNIPARSPPRIFDAEFIPAEAPRYSSTC